MAVLDDGAPDKPEIQARNALRDRGVTDPEALLQHATPGRILAACQRWDAQRAAGRKLTPGWLAKVVRNGGIDEDEGQQQVVDKRAALQHRFEQLTRAFEPGTVTESHMRMQARRWPEETPCPGQLVVTDRTHPALTVRCNECDAVISYPLRALAGLPKPDPEQSVGLSIEGVGTPLLAAPLVAPPERRPEIPAFDLEESPFAGSSSPEEVLAFVTMFAVAAETLDEEQERWAYRQMKDVYLRLTGAPATDELPAGMWPAMRWAVRVLSPPPADLPSSRWMKRHPEALHNPRVPNLQTEGVPQ